MANLSGIGKARAVSSQMLKERERYLKISQEKDKFNISNLKKRHGNGKRK